MLRVFAFLFVVLMLNACSPVKNRYYWGNYETLMYEHLKEVGQVDVDAHVRQLELIVSDANSREQPIAPGVYAHLGYMYSLQGELVKSEKALEEEKHRFPESTLYIDRLIENVKNVGRDNELH